MEVGIESKQHQLFTQKICMEEFTYRHKNQMMEYDAREVSWKAGFRESERIDYFKFKTDIEEDTIQSPDCNSKQT
jgi:hypothetical protein